MKNSKWILAAALVVSPVAFAQQGGHEGHGHAAPTATAAQPAAPAKAAVHKDFKGRTVELTVTDDGFVPANITLKKGEPVKLVVTRKTDATCARELVIDEEKVNQPLPLNQPVEIVFTPKKTGAIKYGCSMGKMVGGVLTIQ